MDRILQEKQCIRKFDLQDRGHTLLKWVFELRKVGCRKAAHFIFFAKQVKHLFGQRLSDILIVASKEAGVLP